MGWVDRTGPVGLGPSRPSPRPPLLYVGSLASWMFLPSACRSMSSVSLRIGHNSLSCKIQHFSGQILGVCRLLGSSPWLLGVKFASLHDLYGASRSCHDDRGGVPDLSVSGDKSDLVVVDPHDPTTTSGTRSANAIAEPTPDGYQPCWRKISLITKINSCAQSKNEQESKASNLNITRRWSLNYPTAARWRLFSCS
jgi:hypothetical protein